jgi:hypothetical protein
VSRAILSHRAPRVASSQLAITIALPVRSPRSRARDLKHARV